MIATPVLEARIQLRIAQLRVQAALTAVAYWRERQIAAERETDAAIERLRNWDWADWDAAQ